MTSLERLQLVQVKVKRAKKNLVDMEEILSPFRDLQDTFSRTNLNPDTGEWERNIPKESVPIIDVAALGIAGDVIHNLRSALDHLAYQLISVATGNEFPEKTGFPIADSPKAYEAEKKRREVERMRPSAIKAIDSLEPYKGGTGHDLWRIHELDRIDKHRLLITVSGMTLCYGDDFGQVLVLEASRPDFIGIFQGEVSEDANFSSHKPFIKAKVPHGDPLLPTLHQYIQFVDDIVVRFLPYLS
jgi:hypothetical protein